MDAIFGLIIINAFADKLPHFDQRLFIVVVWLYLRFFRCTKTGCERLVEKKRLHVIEICTWRLLACAIASI